MFNNNDGTGNILLNDISSVAHDASSATIFNKTLIQDVSAVVDSGSMGSYNYWQAMANDGYGAGYGNSWTQAGSPWYGRYVSSPAVIKALPPNTRVKVTLIGAGGYGYAGGGGGGGGGVIYWTTAADISSTTYRIGRAKNPSSITAAVPEHTHDSSGYVARAGGDGGVTTTAMVSGEIYYGGLGGYGDLSGVTRTGWLSLRGENGHLSSTWGATDVAGGNGGRGPYQAVFTYIGGNPGLTDNAPGKGGNGLGAGGGVASGSNDFSIRRTEGQAQCGGVRFEWFS